MTAAGASAPGRASDLTWHGGAVTRGDRERLLGQRGCVLWFTGLSGSGKSTVARAVEQALAARGRLAYVLDGDNVRHGLNADLGFSDGDRRENIRRLAHVAALFCDAGAITLTAFISPFRAERDLARRVVEADPADAPGRPGAAPPPRRFFEVYVDTPLDACEQRDPKGLYARARSGALPAFTGISSPYEPPDRPDLRLPTHALDVPACAGRVLDLLRARGVMSLTNGGGSGP